MRFEPQDFIDNLKNGTLRRPLTIIGIAKASEDNNSLMLDPTMQCQRWIDIPVGMIAKKGVEWLGDVSCKDHEHPMVKVELKYPTSDESKILANILSASSEQANGIQTISGIQSLRARFIGPWFRYCFDCTSEPNSPFFGTTGCCDVRINTNLSWPWIEYKNCQTSLCMGHQNPVLNR